MNTSGFDQFADTYDDHLNQALAASGETRDYFARRRVQWLVTCLEPLQEHFHTVLDYGCGTGDTSQHLRELLKAQTIVGVDIAERPIAHAEARYGSSTCRFTTPENYVPDQSMDLVYCNGVFHHIPVERRESALDYILRSLRPGGVLALWENNRWNPGTRYVMSHCTFDRDAITLSPPETVRLVSSGGFQVIAVDYQFFFPGFLKFFRFLEPRLSRLPLGGQYQVLCRRPSG